MEKQAQDDDLVMNLVELALDLPERERRAYLQRACGGESELFQQAWEYVQWEARMQGFLLDPLYPRPLNEHPFEPGQLLDGRFRILREVAQGGMGVVYEALDERLERRIAIKCAKNGFRKRLPPEVRNAREISHPNVCKIFEIHTASTPQGDLDFLSMEFIDGQTLAERLRSGALPKIEARLIARQLCDGLAEAHRNQVIHGDLKSNNIILATAPAGTTHAVITDFGLARTHRASLTTMTSGLLGGTPDYMAPELWKGEKASVSSDIYALGVILYEMASGRRPYPQESLWQERTTCKPPAVDPSWDRILARCLDSDPTRRFETVDELERAFEPPRSRRWFLAAAAAAVLAIASGTVTYRRATAPQDTVRLEVLPFSSSPDIAPVMDVLTRDLASQVARLKGSARTALTVIPLTETLRNRVDDPGKARSVSRATHVLRGTAEMAGGNLILNAMLTDTRSGVNTKEWKAQYKLAEMRYAPLALAGMVSGTLRLPPLIARATTVNAAARQDYLQGLWYVRRDKGVDAALASLERAVAADPDSPLTFAALAEAEWFKYLLTRDQSWRERASAATRQAELRNPDLAPVHRLVGLLRADTGYYETASTEYLRAIELDPTNGDAYRRLGQVYEKNSQLDEAVIAFRKAVELDPEQYRNHQDLGNFYFQRAEYEEALKHFGRTVQLAPEEASPHFVLALALTNLGRFEEAEPELRTAISLKKTANALHQLGLTLMYQRREREAIPYFELALNLKSNRYISLTWMDLGICYRRLNLLAESEQANRRGLAVAEAEMKRDARNGYVRSMLAYLCARLRDRSRAESEIAQALQLSPNDTDTGWMVALTYEALNRRDATLAFLASAPVGMLADLNRWPDVADLRNDTRFLQLLTSHQVSK